MKRSRWFSGIALLGVTLVLYGIHIAEKSSLRADQSPLAAIRFYRMTFQSPASAEMKPSSQERDVAKDKETDWQQVRLNAEKAPIKNTEKEKGEEAEEKGEEASRKSADLLSDASWWRATYPKAVARIADKHWRHSSWWTPSFAGTLHKLLLNAATTGRNITIATLGGSASSLVPPMFMHHMADELQDLMSQILRDSQRRPPHIRTINPSAGNTGSEWAALLMDSLLPQGVDILLWEFAINDWLAESVTEIPSLQRRRQIFELFLHRAWAMNPNMIIGLVSLWPPGAAANCWPCTASGSELYKHILTIAMCYQQEAIFGTDFRDLLASRGMKTKSVFRDGHHPNANGYKEIGSALYDHILRAFISPKDKPRVDAICTPEDQSVRPQETRDSPLPVFSLSTAAMKIPLLSRLWDAQHPLVSIHYDSVRFHGITKHTVTQITAHEAEQSGKAYEHRIDRKKFMRVPLCSEGNPLAYRITHQGPRMQFVGLNVRTRDGTLLVRTPRSFKDLHINITSPTHVVATSLHTTELRSSLHAAALTRGFCAPQAWFAIGNHGVPYPVELSICGTSVWAIGSIVFV